MSTMLLTYFALVIVLDALSYGAASFTPNTRNVDLNSSIIALPAEFPFPSSFIINGFYVSEISMKIPWIVVLFQNDEPFCTGSLINNQYILTAAHCVVMKPNNDCGAPFEKRSFNLQAIIGESNFNNAKHNANKIHQVIHYWIHDQYKGGLCNSWSFDLAIVKLQRPVNIIPVCLHSGTHMNIGNIYAVGYGATYPYQGAGMSNLLKGVKVNNLPVKECNQRWADKVIRDNQICTVPVPRDDDRYSGTCKGDSGGPLVLYDESYGFIQIGVTSFGYQDSQYTCAKNAPDVYARVASGIAWIKSKAGYIKTC